MAHDIQIMKYICVTLVGSGRLAAVEDDFSFKLFDQVSIGIVNSSMCKGDKCCEANWDQTKILFTESTV